MLCNCANRGFSCTSPQLLKQFDISLDWLLIRHVLVIKWWSRLFQGYPRSCYSRTCSLSVSGWCNFIPPTTNDFLLPYSSILPGWQQCRTHSRCGKRGLRFPHPAQWNHQPECHFDYRWALYGDCDRQWRNCRSSLIGALAEEFFSLPTELFTLRNNFAWSTTIWVGSCSVMHDTGEIGWIIC